MIDFPVPNFPIPIPCPNPSILAVAVTAVVPVLVPFAGHVSRLSYREMPTLMYSALNLRPYFTKPPSSSLWNSYWYLAIGYFNVILPSFLPSGVPSQEPTFWLRARQAKEQSTRAAKNPLVASRTQEMARERGARARAWGKEDDEREKGTYVPPAPAPAPESEYVL